MTNILTLQKDVCQLIQEVEKILEQRIQSTDLIERNQDYHTLLNKIKKGASKLNTLELKMTIVAPMSAGKSTIVNAIIGHELLPTSASAMTTIPTEIILDKNIDEPILTLGDEVLSVSDKMLKTLKNYRKSQELSDIKKQLGSYPHLIDLAEDISNCKIKINDELKGYKNIRENLTILNNIFRLFNLLIPEENPLYELNSCPQIRTPFDYKLTPSNETEYMGHLVIIDTPGPNEARQNFTLAPIVKKQLTENADLVLIVLDFTQLNTESAEKIRTEVNKVIELINKENLYIIVNKIDQRKKNDPLNSEKLKQFILSQFDLDDSEKAHHKIFEISGRQALCASKFINEFSQNSDKEVQDLETVESFAEEVYGIDWEEELEQATPQILRNKAEKLWNKSGFSSFTDNAIQDILITILPTLINTSLGLGNNVLTQLKEELTFKLNTLNSDQNNIKNEIEKLAGNKEIILAKQSILNDKFREQIQDFKNNFEKIKDEIESKSFDDILKPQIEQFLKEQKLAIKNFKFTNKIEANKFGEEVYQSIIRFLENWFSKYKDKIEATIIFFETHINIHVTDCKIKTIFNEIKTQLKNKFDFDMSLSYQMSNFDYFNTFINSKKYQIDINADVPLLGKIHNNFAVKLGKLVKLEIPLAEDEYKIYINKYVKQVSKIIEENIQELAEQIKHFTDEESKKFQNYTNDIERSINNCIKTLEDSIKDQNLSKEDFDAKIQRLQQLLKETECLINQTNEINDRSKELIKS